MLILSWESGNELDVHYVNVDGKFYMFQYQYHVLPASSLTSIQPLFFFIPSLLSLLFYAYVFTIYEFNYLDFNS